MRRRRPLKLQDPRMLTRLLAKRSATRRGEARRIGAQAGGGAHRRGRGGRDDAAAEPKRRDSMSV